jgi:hypothetical protein
VIRQPHPRPGECDEGIRGLLIIVDAVGIATGDSPCARACERVESIMRRLPVVAIGVALCALATGAEARSEHVRLASYDGYRPYADGDWDDDGPRLRPQTLRPAPRRQAAARRAGRRQERRSERRMRAARQAPRSPLASRGFVSFARGGVSRTCLTPDARGLLARIEAQFGPVGIVSTCRPGAVIAGTGHPSRHASGNAIDFNAPAGRKAELVHWLIANHRSGGVMTYRDMNHIHVDVGRHFVVLGAASGGGGHGRWR